MEFGVRYVTTSGLAWAPFSDTNWREWPPTSGEDTTDLIDRIATYEPLVRHRLYRTVRMDSQDSR